MAFIRRYEPSDFEATAHICRETLASSLLGSEPARRLAPYVWTHQYTHLSPSTCFVLDDGSGSGTGSVVGYCVGTADVDGFVAGYGSYVREVLEPSGEISRPGNVTDGEPEPWRVPADKGNGEGGGGKDVPNGTRLAQMAYNPAWLLRAGNEDLRAAGYGGATMHVNLLPGWQGRGWGGLLVGRFLEAVKGEMEKKQREVKKEEGGKEEEEVVDGTRGLWIGVAGENGRVVPFYERLGFRVWDRGEGGIRMVRDIPLGEQQQ
ncbi:hypothetical protein N3K66_004735 [Trichothecium roseum]|uniref:Uncharacterized protein n=1 Tax=Trichothecium roseum TaxID=47278 RepID=A0ACC0V216_9HYPO|nr:hypothetical protein N3K66_004735 [Trichothecium roseum]